MLIKKIVLSLALGILLQGCIPSLDILKPKVYYSDKPVVMFILDTSGSMDKFEGGQKRIETAKSSIIDTISKIDNQRFNTSLITFRGNCGSNLLVPPSNNLSSIIIDEIRGLKADGGTPLAATIAYAGDILKNVRKKKVILLSDGEEGCGGNPVREAKKLYDKYDLDINFQVIGYAVDNQTRKMLEEITNVSPSWKYHDAKDARSVDAIINNILRDEGLTSAPWSGNNYSFQFSSDSTKLTSSYIEKIIGLYNYMKYNSQTIVITGHTDARGPKVYNKKLSLKRAKMVQSKLMELGIEKDRIRTRGEGEENPISSNNTVEGRKLNRRVDIEVIKQY